MHERWGVEIVFPSTFGSHGILGEGTLNGYCQQHNIPGTPHGFRSSVRSWCGDTQVLFDVAEIALGHALPPVVRAYLRSDLLEVRSKLMDYWQQYLMGELPSDWAWSTGPDAQLVWQVEELTETIKALTEQIAVFADLLAASERRAEAAEELLAQKELELKRLRHQVAPTIEMDLGIRARFRSWLQSLNEQLCYD